MNKKWFVVLKAFTDDDGTEHKPADGNERYLLELDADHEKVKALVASKTLEQTELNSEEKVADEVRAMVKKSLMSVVPALVGEAVTSAASQLQAADDRAPSGTKFQVGIDRALQDPMLGFKSVGHFFKAVRDHKVNKTVAPVMEEYIEKIGKINGLESTKVYEGQNEAIGDEGSILAPAEISNKIHAKVFAPNTLLGDTDRYSVRGNAITFPRAKDQSRANGARHAGVTSAWLSAGETLSFQKLGGLDEVSLKLGKLGVLTAITEEMLADSAGLIEQWVTKNVAAEIAFEVARVLWEGDGVKKPHGFMDTNSGVLLDISREEADNVTGTDICTMMSYLFAQSYMKAKWYVHQRIPWEYFMKMYFPAKNAADDAVGGWPIFLPPQGIAATPGGVLLGRPVIPQEFCYAPGTAGDVVLADMNEMVVVTKGGAGDVAAVKTAMSIHFLFDMDATAFRATYRIDGQPWQNSLITPYRDDVGVKYATFLRLADAA